MKRKSVILLFAVGALVGVPLSVTYALVMTPEDRYFHSFVMLAACGVSFPAVVIFLRVTLDMWARAIRSEAIMQELRDEIKPITKDAREVIGAVHELVEDLKGQNPKRIVEFVDRLSRDGVIDRIAGTVEKVGEKIGDAIKRIEEKAAGKLIDNI